MSILVTGGAGYVGSHMVHALVESGERVVVLDNLSTGFRWAIPKDVELIVGETGDDALVRRLITEREVSAIIHFASSIVVPDSVSDPLGYYRNNTVNSRALIECAVRGGVKQFIFSSTAAVYGNPAKVPISEDDAAAPMSPYGSSKLMTEIMLRDAAIAHGLDYVILRYFNVAGADPSLRTGQSTKGATHLIKVAVETALGKRAKMAVFGTDYPTPDGSCIRDYIHVADLCAPMPMRWPICGQAADQRRSTAATATDSLCLEVIDTIKRVSGVDFCVDRAGSRPGDPAWIVAQSDRARELLGWQPQFDDLATIVTHALAWEPKLATLQNW